MHRLLLHLILLAGAMLLLCCLGFFLLSLLATTSDVPAVPSSSHAEGNNMGHVDRGANDPASLPDGSYLLTSAEEAQETDKAPMNAYLLTMFVLALASSLGTSVSGLLTTNARRRRGTLVCSGVDDGVWLAVAHEGPSFLGVFLL